LIENHRLFGGQPQVKGEVFNYSAGNALKKKPFNELSAT
jgi:hypothetical protein